MTKKMNFEESMVKIEETINKLQSGYMELDKSIDEFKNGLELINQAQKKLDDAKLKVEKIVKENSEIKFEEL